MEQQKPTYGSTEFVQQGLEASKTDAFDISDNASRLKRFMVDEINTPGIDTESPEAVAERQDRMVNRLGGLTTSAEVEDPRG